MFIFVIILSTLVQGLVALFVLQKNTRHLTNSLFFMLSLFMITWADINFVITNNPFSTGQLFLYRLLMGSVVVLNSFFFLFAHTYPNKSIDISGKYLKTYIALSGVALIAALSPLVFTRISFIKIGAWPEAGPGMLLFIVHAGVSVASGLHAIYKRYKNSHAISKQQFQLVFIASLIFWGAVPLTNFLITLAAQTFFFARIGPIYTLAFSSIIAYAIVAKRLFDIRAAVARSVGYVLIIGSMVGIYSVGLFGIINIVFHGTNQEMVRQVWSIILLMPLAISFQYIKAFFDKLTNRLFYRESYDFQEVLDQIGDIVVAEIDLDRILKSTRRVLSEALKASFIEFVLIRNGDAFFETKHQLVPHIGQLGRQLNEQHRELLVTEELNMQNPLQRPLSQAQVALSLRLRTQRQVVGYVLIGYKRSGDVYGLQDRRLLTIVASELAIAIQNALRFEEIQNFNVTLQAKVDEATRRLRETNQRLKLLDETKDDFISMASHQLRTPLTSVKGYVSMVLDGDAGPIKPDQRRLLDQAYFSSQRMVYLIADLLNVSRLRTGKFVIEPTSVNLADIVQDEVRQLAETAAGRKLELHYDKPVEYPVLNLDETKIRQVIMNFIDNAIYYTPAGGHITVLLKDNDISIELRVVDDGIGVPKAERHHLFNKFYRAKNAQNARPDGTGLGLFMAKKVIVAQGGAIIFNSQEGKGSTFGFTFPKAALQKLPSAGSVAK